MKAWFFTFLEIVIAAAAVGAFWLGENLFLILGCAVLLVIHCVQSGRRRVQKARLNKATQADALQRLRHLHDTPTQLPLPHRGLVDILLQQRHPTTAKQLLGQYDRLIRAIEEKSFAAEELAAAWNDKVEPWAVASYLRGLAAREAGDLLAAKRFFWKATQLKPSWSSPCLGWTATAFELRDFDEILQHHPHANSRELAPHDCGDEATTRTLPEKEQAHVEQLFRTTAPVLSDYWELATAEAAEANYRSGEQRLNAAA